MHHYFLGEFPMSDENDLEAPKPERGDRHLQIGGVGDRSSIR